MINVAKSHSQKDFKEQLKELNGPSFNEEATCFSDSCPANQRVSEIQNELLEKNREVLAFSEFYSHQHKNLSKSEKVEKNEVSLVDFVRKFQDHLEKIALKKQMEMLQTRVKALEKKVDDQTSFDLSKLEFVGDPQNPFAPKFANKEAKKRFWKSNYTIDQILEDVEVDEFE